MDILFHNYNQDGYLSPTKSFSNIDLFFEFARNHLNLSEKDLVSASNFIDYNLATLSKNFELVLKILKHDASQNALIALENSKKKRKSSLNGPSMRELVIKELVSTEKAYVKDLEVINTSVVKLVREKQLMTEEEIATLFMNVEELYQFHSRFSTEIDVEENISIAFLSNVKFFEELYQNYCTGQTQAVELLASLKDSNKLVDFFAQIDPTWHVFWSSNLIKPVQRILKYHLLLKELVKNTSNDAPNYQQLNEALDCMMKVAMNINEIKRKKECEKALKDLSEKITDYEGSALTNYGELLIEGNLQLFEKSTKKTNTTKEMSFHVYLFRDLLIYVKENIKQKGVSYKFRGQMLTAELKVKEFTDIPISEGGDCMFELERDLQKGYLIACRCVEDKERWIATINEAIKSSKEFNANRPAISADTISRTLSVKKSSKLQSVIDGMRRDSKEDELGKSATLKEFKNDTKSKRKTLNDISSMKSEVKLSLEELKEIMATSSSKQSLKNLEEEKKAAELRKLRFKYSRELERELSVQLHHVRTFQKYEEELRNMQDVWSLVKTQSRKCELELIKEKSAGKYLEDKLQDEVRRREENVKTLNQVLIFFKESNRLINLALEKDRAGKDKIVSKINALGVQLGYGSVLPQSLASIMNLNQKEKSLSNLCAALEEQIKLQ